MVPEKLYEEIRDYCRANTDEDMVKKYSRYFKEGYDAYGLSSELLEEKVSAILEDPDMNMKLILRTGKLLVESGKYEETFFAILLLKHFVEEFDTDVFEEIGHWFDVGIVNWAHADVFCRDLTSTFLLNDIIDLKSLGSWQTGANKYQRRSVPVAMIDLLKTRDDYQPLFDFIEPLMLDTERTVQQGLGWFLREAWKIKKEETESFLLKWKNDAPRTIYQYATEKMSKEDKTRFRKEKQNKK
jgi:3-methyladenine DNA glycosylase AlkD